MANIGTAPRSTTENDAAPLMLVGAIVALFFIWGGLTSLNDILVPKLKGLFQLSCSDRLSNHERFNGPATHRRGCDSCGGFRIGLTIRLGRTLPINQS